MSDSKGECRRSTGCHAAVFYTDSLSLNSVALLWGYFKLDAGSANAFILILGRGSVPVWHS